MIVTVLSNGPNDMLSCAVGSRSSVLASVASGAIAELKVGRGLRHES